VHAVVGGTLQIMQKSGPAHRAVPPAGYILTAIASPEGKPHRVVLRPHNRSGRRVPTTTAAGTAAAPREPPRVPRCYGRHSSRSARGKSPAGSRSTAVGPRAVAAH